MTKRIYTNNETFAKSIVDSIKSKKIKFGKVVAVTGLKTGERYTSIKNENGSYLTVERVTSKKSKQARAFMVLTSPGSIKGTMRNDLITGEFARKAFLAVNYEPKSVKSTLTKEDISELSSAFGL